MSHVDERLRGLLTLGVHEVANGHEVAAGGVDEGLLGFEHGLEVALGAGAEVLLREVLHLHADGVGILWTGIIVSRESLHGGKPVGSVCAQQRQIALRWRTSSTKMGEVEG